MVDIQHTDLTPTQSHPPKAETFTGLASAYTPTAANQLVVKTDVTPHELFRTTGVLAGDVVKIGIIELLDDTTPQLGGDLDVNGQSIVSTSAGDISITPDTTGSVVIDGLNWPQADGTSNQVLTTDGLGQLSFSSAAGGLANVVEDLTPQLGGDLDVNGQSIVSVSAGNIAITPDTTGSVVLDGLNWPQADGTNGQVIVTDGLGQLSFANQTGGGASVQVQYQYSNTTTSGDPGAGNFRLNNTTIASATNLFVSQESKAGADLSALLDTLQADDKIYIQRIDDSTERLLIDITSVTDNTTWYDIVFTVDDSNGPTWTDGEEFGFILVFSANAGGGINNVVEDLTPQLGGDLDVNGQSIVSVSAGNIAITPDTTGSVVLDGLNWPQADGTNGQIIQTDGLGQLSFVTPGAGSSLNINYEFQYSTTTTSGDPGSGGFRLNNTTIASATSLFISQTNAAGADLSTIFDTLGSGDKIYLQNNADSTERLLLDITSVTDNTTWYDITLTVDDSNGPTWTNAADFGLIFEHTASGGGGGGTTTVEERVVISSVTTSGSQATVTFSSIPQTYTDLEIEISIKSTRVSTLDNLITVVNSDTTAANYITQSFFGNNGSSSTPEENNSNIIDFLLTATNSPGNVFTKGKILIPDYTDTTEYQSFRLETIALLATSQIYVGIGAIYWRNTAAVTDLEFSIENGNFTDGSVLTLIGKQLVTVSTP